MQVIRTMVLCLAAAGAALFAGNGVLRAEQKSAAELVKGLTSGTEKSRSNCAAAVEKLERISKKLVPGLIAALKDKRYLVRKAAVTALTKVDGGEDAASALIAMHKNDNAFLLRQLAAEALGKIGPRAAAAIPALKATLVENAHLSRAAAGALVRIGSEGSAALLSVLEDPDKKVRIASIRALGSSGIGSAKAVAAACKLLEDEEDSVKVAAAWALADMGKDAKEAVPVLIAFVKGKRNFIQQAGITALAKIAPLNGKAVTVVFGAVRGLSGKWGDKNLYTAVVHAVKHTGADAVPVLIAGLGDENGTVRHLAILALGHVGPKASGAVSALVPFLKGEHAKDTAETLAKIGAAAVSVLARTVGSKDERSRAAAVHAFSVPGPARTKAVPVLTALLGSGDPAIRAAAAAALAHIGPDAKDAAPSLIARLEDKEASVRIAAVNALAKIGVQSEAAIPTIIEFLKDAKLRNTAIDALGDFGEKAKDGVVPLLAIAAGQDIFIGRKARHAVAKIGAAAVPALIEALKDTDASVRKTAAKVLQLIGPDAKPAIPALTKLLKD